MECKANRLSQTAKWLQIPSIAVATISTTPLLHSKPAIKHIKLKNVEPLSPDMPLIGKLPHIGIVGAGIAGLRCADVLLGRGFRVTILEARDYIGGRVCQSNVGDIMVDLGPNWIHGTRNNPIVEISELSKTITYALNGSQGVVDRSGRSMDTKTTTKLADFMWTTIDKAFEYSRRNSDRIPATTSLFDYFKTNLETSGFPSDEQEACLELSKLWGAYIGSPVDRQSLKFFFLEESNLLVASTHRDILKYIAKPAMEGADIRLNEPVVAIDAQPRKAEMDHHISVTTTSGKQYKFDELVTTFPLGWLKQNKAVFKPELPPRLSKAIDSISYGQLEKVYVHFPSAFWHVPQSHESEPSTARGPMGAAERKEGANIAEPEPTGTPAFTQFMAPNYVDHPDTPFWNQECLSLAAMPENLSHPTLLFYMYGTCAAEIVSRIAHHPVDSKEYSTILNDFLYPYYSRLPHYDPSSPSCKPIAFLATQWQNDPWAGHGSYSNFQVGLEEGDRDIITMREGMGVERGVWFAGEHTAPFVGLGTTSGAYWSGEHAAERICEFLEKGSVSSPCRSEVDGRFVV
ncbi:hypothetical protein AJ80_08783 [Polytolypa hystricis UAMH7299]|uniref:Amine oxidase domain-containing protein n=1 Tax=Polytolypa hystricis (strain UAMH7299) TaxID=1447883 RepID=A0A2B7X1S8_POLH7|nr:hypothetical protein AJ80_08783 [Polytolypa hystricis UAMH7299]